MSDRHNYDACPLCEGQDLKKFNTADCSGHTLYKPSLTPTMVWMICSGCNHVFTSGYFTDAANEIIFSKTHPYQSVGHEIEKNRYLSASMVEKVLPYAKDGVWMDVGFGNGSLLFTAMEFGFQPLGVDLRKDCVDSMKQLGIEAYCQDVATLNLEKRCRVVSLMDVLEHVPYPKTFLKGVYDSMEDGGVLLISCPNSESLLWDYLTGAKKIRIGAKSSISTTSAAHGSLRC
jgi:2-polyprenyl-3-methyl-5-hydroxy-6-metoxy-1,4-benzoquinol methylase